MREHEFSLVLTCEPDEQQADRLYGTFNDGTLLTESGTPLIRFHREAQSLEDAIRSAIDDVRRGGQEVLRAEMQPQDVAPVG